MSQFNHSVVFWFQISVNYFVLFFFFYLSQPSNYYVIKQKDQITELGGQRKHFDKKCKNSAPAESSWISL